MAYSGGSSIRHVPPVYLAGKPTDVILLVFSPQETHLACVSVFDNRITFWDLATSGCVSEVFDVWISQTAFSSDGLRFGVYGPQGVQVIDIATGTSAWIHSLDGLPHVSFPVYLSFIDHNRLLLLGLQNRLFWIDANSGELVKTISVTPETATAFYGAAVGKNGGTVVCYGTTKSRAQQLYFRSVTNDAIDLRIELGAQDWFDVSPRTLITLIRREGSPHGELLNFRETQMTLSIPFPGFSSGLIRGGQDRYLGQLYYNPAVRIGAETCLDVWDLKDGRLVTSISGSYSTNGIWCDNKTKFAFIGIPNSFDHLTAISSCLIVDPLSGAELSYTTGHSVCGFQQYSLSVSGRWLASYFPEDVNLHGTSIKAGTVALSDLDESG